MKRYCDELANLRAGEAGKKVLVELLVSHEAGETTTGARSRRPVLRAALIAAAVAALLAAGALAANLGVWQRFFRGNGGDAVTPVGVSATTGDYTITLEESIVDEDEATFLLALTRTDGGMLEGEPDISGRLFTWRVMVDGEFPTNMAYGNQEPIRAEDGRTVYYCVDFHGSDLENEPVDLMGKEITFQCRAIVDRDWSQEAINGIDRQTVSLAPMADVAAEVEQTWQELVAERTWDRTAELLAGMAEAKVPLTLNGRQVTSVAGIIFAADGPIVAVDHFAENYREGVYLATGATPAWLTDTRTEESWGVAECLYRESCGVARFEEGCPLTAEDLPYVELTVGYQMEKLLSDEPVEFTFQAQQGDNIITRNVNRDVVFQGPFDRYEGRLTSVRVSALNLRLNLEDATFFSDDGTGDWDISMGRLVMKDGSEWTVYLDSDRMLPGDAGRGWVRLQARGPRGQRTLIDPQAVRTLILGDCEIDLAA